MKDLTTEQKITKVGVWSLAALHDGTPYALHPGRVLLPGVLHYELFKHRSKLERESQRG